jgi:hypothetical protein
MGKRRDPRQALLHEGREVQFGRMDHEPRAGTKSDCTWNPSGAIESAFFLGGRQEESTIRCQASRSDQPGQEGGSQEESQAGRGVSKSEGMYGGPYLIENILNQDRLPHRRRGRN